VLVDRERWVGRSTRPEQEGDAMEGQPTRESIDEQVGGSGDEGRRTEEASPPIAEDAKKGQTQAPPEPDDVGVPSDEELAEEE
jgi:hypothetical protein